jgi:anti-sigma regulatory factor (Ser/Thr protein kinase)/GNAT superfamily N-acetyltransferase
MPDAVRTQLTLPGEARWLRLVQDYGRTLAELADFPPDQVESLALALREACINCIKHAFDEDEFGTITLVGELTPAALTLAVHDRGLPFDQSLDQAASSSDPKTSSSAVRISHGLSLIHQCADEVHWLNHGPEGKELRLIKYRPGWRRLAPQPAPPDQAPPQAAPGPRPQNYTIRLVRPEDAIGVAQLIYRVYGSTYPRVDIYYPERLAHHIKTGVHIGVVAVADDGEIAGHAGLLRPHSGSLGELAELAVAPRHRGQGLMKRMENRIQEEIPRLGLTGLYGEAITLHSIGQEAAEAQGLHVTGLQLLYLQIHLKGLEISPNDLTSRANQPGPAPQRESVVFYFKYLAPPATTRVCAPDRHRDILAKIYGNLGVPVKFLRPGPATGSGRLAVHFNQNISTGFIQVNRIGTDTFPEIEQACRDLCDLAGAAVVFLDLPLAQRGTPDLCEAAEAVGFFFSGVRPHFAPDGDCLRLQYLNAEFDPERLHLFSPFARELLAYILKDKARGQQHLKT